MARQNMNQIIEETIVPENFDMTINEWQKLIQKPEPEAVRDAFKYGFALGTQYQKGKSQYED